jgi:hypothetical protein
VLAAASVGAELLVLCPSSHPGHGEAPGGHVLQRVLGTLFCPVDTCASDSLEIA